MFRFASRSQCTARPESGGAALAAEPAGSYVAAAPGCPVAGRLDRVAELAEQRDRLMGELVRLLVSVSTDDGLAELTGGMSLHVWLQHTARCTRGEARDVLGAVDVLRAMPATLAGLSDRWLSWSQTAAISKAARRVPVARRGELDGLVASAMVAHRDWEPDALVADVWDWVDQQRRALTRGHGRALADRLVGLCERDLAGTTDAAAGAPVGSRPMLLATIDLEALLDRTRTPGWLLHTLAGGRMKVSAATLQRLVDTRGADLRTIVLDDTGQAVGVGTKTSVPPRWLREATWARDLAVRDPDGTTPVRRADLDHTVAWPDGSTDVTNLAPLGRRWHNRKTSKTWTLHRARDGTTTWRHRRHGWTIRLAPPRRDLTDVPDPGPPRLPLHLNEPAPTLA